jgi:hypothetical protein
VLHTVVSKPIPLYRPLDRALDHELGDKVSFTTREGELTLNQYVESQGAGRGDGA